MKNITCFINIFVSSTLILLTVVINVKSSAISIDNIEKSHLSFVEFEDEQPPAKEFSNYSIVEPVIYHGRERREINQNKWSQHPNKITVILPDNNKKLILDLVLNIQLIPKHYFRQIQENGTAKVQKLAPEEIQICHYTGKVRSKPDSWVAVSTCDGLSGVIYDGNQTYYIDKKKNRKNNEHFLYNGKNLTQDNSCGSREKTKIMFRNKRTIKKPWNANLESRYVELVLVVDNGKYKEMNENLKEVEDYCKNIVNIMNGLYSTLNIFIALVGVVVWTEHDEIEISSDPEKTLSNFLGYRRERLVRDHPNDNAQLIVKTSFANGVVGKALSRPICSFEYSGGITSGQFSVVGVTANTVAHMLGHNLGMEHDTAQCECPDDKCIMTSKFSSTPPTHWSSCSRSKLQYAYEYGLDHCLRNKPDSLFKGPVCGNGFQEEGEECDCGLPEYCNNCCNPATCRLQINATCATGECCDLKTCKFKRPGKICRNLANECDLPEFCTGDSEFCPPDVYKIDTEVCELGNGYCYQGRCDTHFTQCRLLWGSTGKKGHDNCFKLNNKGSRHGNCGYNKLNNTYYKCNEEDVFCGRLHCYQKDFDDGLHYGLDSTTILSHIYINIKGTIKLCKTAVVDLGLSDKDPGMVPDGAKCGDGKICLNQKCVPLATLEQGRMCPHNCYNNGWCNNLGHCHCKPGYVLPYCQYLSPGGSVDSGPPDTAVPNLDTVLLL